MGLCAMACPGVMAHELGAESKLFWKVKVLMAIDKLRQVLSGGK